MTFETRITRSPRAYEPERGAEARAALPDLSGASAEVIAGAAGSAPYLHGLILKEADWLPEGLADPEVALAAEIARIDALPPIGSTAACGRPNAASHFCRRSAISAGSGRFPRLPARSRFWPTGRPMWRYGRMWRGRSAGARSPARPRRISKAAAVCSRWPWASTGPGS